MPWTRSLLAQLLTPYLIGLAVFAAVLYLHGSPWLSAAGGGVATILSAGSLARRFRRVAELSRSIAPDPFAPADDGVHVLEANLVAAASTFRAQLDAVREEKGELAAILSGMVEGVLVLDRNGDIRLSNRAADQLFGADGILAGRPLISLSRDPDLLDLVREVTRREVSRPGRCEIPLEGAGGQTLQVTATAMGEIGSASQLVLLVFHDITELKKLEAARRDFVANVSHELRTPLTAIRGYAETLQSGALENPELAHRFVEVIARHSERLGRLIDDLLVLSDLELGRTEIQRSPIGLEGAVDAAMEVLREKAEQRHVVLRREVVADTPMVLADADRIEQLLVNLVDNAVKYTPEGGSVTVIARGDAAPEGENGAAAADRPSWVELSVADNGIGIAKHELPRLTERFYRVDKARSRALGGTGLGLAIVKHIVQAHGGSMKIESDFGKGTCVRVYLPAAPAEA